MLIKSISVGWLQANCYIVTDEKTMASAVIDPGDGLSEILDYLEGHSLNVKCILLTHGHFDHTGAAVGLHEETGAPIYIHAADLSKGDDPLKLTTKSDFVNCYKEGDSVNVGGLHFDVLETPGHTSTFRAPAGYVPPAGRRSGQTAAADRGNRRSRRSCPGGRSAEPVRRPPVRRPPRKPRRPARRGRCAPLL